MKSLRPRKFPLFGSLGLALAIFSAPVSAYFPKLFQRSMYSENLAMPGAWWANPASIGLCTSRAFVTANVLPLGDTLLLSSGRVLFPMSGTPIVFGIGILGDGHYKPGSSNSDVSSGGFTYTSSFAFKYPRFQAGFAFQSIMGSVGLLGTFGPEPIPGEDASSFSPGFGLGWLSPELLGSIRFSVSHMWIRHKTHEVLRESGNKVGVLASFMDSLLTLTGEYSFTFSEGFGIFTPNSASYETAKLLASFKINKSMAVLGGVSSDLDFYYQNRTLVHLGMEMRRNASNPFFGGYEMGIRLGRNWGIIHRIWLGLDLAEAKRAS